jgi:hypothetical protein
MPFNRVPPLVKQIITGLRYRYASLNNVHYEAVWTDRQCERRCQHRHQMLTDAAACGLYRASGWYVVAVERGEPRQLTTSETKIVNNFRAVKGTVIFKSQSVSHTRSITFDTSSAADLKFKDPSQTQDQHKDELAPPSQRQVTQRASN